MNQCIYIHRKQIEARGSGLRRSSRTSTELIRFSATYTEGEDSLPAKRSAEAVKQTEAALYSSRATR